MGDTEGYRNLKEILELLKGKKEIQKLVKSMFVMGYLTCRDEMTSGLKDFVSNWDTIYECKLDFESDESDSEFESTV